MLERELQSQILKLCTALGLLAYHTHDSRRSQAGFPDLVVVGANGVLYRELKKADGKVSDEQQLWIDCLNAAGQDAAVWRPVDWPVRVQRELQALGRCAPQRAFSPEQVRAHLQKRVTKSLT